MLLSVFSSFTIPNALTEGTKGRYTTLQAVNRYVGEDRSQDEPHHCLAIRPSVGQTIFLPIPFQTKVLSES
ncbi:unnamed protein product [Onchocerca flexuosa]|uniref:Secreted protein n=1 Tax=Onchocerca flexuosa TaxID=387005 RepID=A0A183HY05_9BILA|nr:unnamed protein product [Onchocerca flexuosa]